MGTFPSSPVASNIPVAVTGTLGGNVVQDNISGSIYLDGQAICSVTKAPGSCSAMINPGVGPHTLAWSCTASGTGVTGQNSSSEPLTIVQGPTSRNFAMALGTTNPLDADVPFLNAGNAGGLRGNDTQTSGVSLISLGYTLSSSRLPVPQYGLPSTDLNNKTYDYTRIAAVNVDEPYVLLTQPPYTGSNPSWANPCKDLENNAPNDRYPVVQQIFTQLQELALAIHQTAPKTRFWVNYSEPEVQWMMDPNCPAGRSMGFLNSPFIDVVSMDKYKVPFATTAECAIVLQQSAACVQPYYDWLVANRAYPGQQIAFIAGTFADNTPSGDAHSQALLLQGFFDYATARDRVCDNPLGNTGVTGHADGCLVWMVDGFNAHFFPPTTMIGEEDPGGQPIQQLWRAQVALPLTVPWTRPASLASLSSSAGAPSTYFLSSNGHVYVISCPPSGCFWDDPSGDAGDGPDGAAPPAATGSPLNILSTANGLIAYYLTPSGHVISLNTSLGFSDTWQDVTAAGGTFAAVSAGPLVTIMNGQTPLTFFLTGGGALIDNWCNGSGCFWDDLSGDAGRGPNGAPPTAAIGTPLNVVPTANGLIAYYLAANGHVISLNTSLGLSNTWQDITAAGGTFAAAPTSPLVTVMNGQTPFTFFLTGGGALIDNWCTGSRCFWDDPSGDAERGPNGAPPTAAIGTPLNVVPTANGLIAYYLAANGHVISLNTSLGLSNTWQDITAVSAAPAAANLSPLTTVLTANGTSITHFVIPGGHLYSISCTSTGSCTAMDETQGAKATFAPVAVF